MTAKARHDGGLFYVSLFLHRPQANDASRRIDTGLGLIDRLDDGIAEQLGEARIPPIVHVQAVRDREALERQLLVLMPLPHYLETREDGDVTQPRALADQLRHPARAFL